MKLWVLVLVLLWGPVAALAQELSALARLVPERSWVEDRRGGLEVELALSQPVPWRVRVLDAPPRLVLDTREVDWTGLTGLEERSDAVLGLRAGVVRQGWSRLVLELDGPAVVARAEMLTGDQGAKVRLRLETASDEDFAAAAAVPEPEGWALPAVADLPRPVPRGTGPVVVVLDPGHGGIDPGAERDGFSEAGLMLTFARELKDVLVRDGGFLVILTRDEDVFVPLEARISIARAAGAHVFVSLHADAIAEGEAVGATIYTLSEEASDAASQALAERHDRADLLSGVDLTAQDDLVATILMDMARTETGPRIERLALALESAIKGAGLRMHRHPRQTAGFSVLKSPDIPSVLVELGFMSSERDLARLVDREWRAKMALALRDGLKAWAEEDAALSALQR
ncbi:N-acetylmuramoyl-L-alanine amidase [Pseudotabrizicola algicola]|uniref:N-acetylmuramoyl-L-alanine amidase n=1 Tax=Pseudotabrizicola algicola TaxID=2709381 RepID=A0A6B3RIT4_9RHOB|nr:N-acetylmuramoyl-L-alanine amidase [Pseudotabrizicola algicola]NEX45096.1 N-acetylmuramoyl-L-alanine amidase [Pseudotabrizicola algicola]